MTDKISPAGFFKMRAPLLPFDDFVRWGEGTTDRAELRRRLREIVKRPEVREALYVGSPDLETALPEWESDPTGEKGERAEKSLVRYFARMAGRPTPYGLFAAFATGTVAKTTELNIAPRSEAWRHTRLDMEYVSACVDELDKRPELRARLSYRTNSSLYTAAGRYRYVEHTFENGMRKHRLVAVDRSEYLARVLDRASAAPAKLSELAGLLVEDDITLAEAEVFVNELIDTQLLVSELEPEVTGPEPVPLLVERLQRLQGAGDVAATLVGVQASIAAIDRSPLGADPALYREVVKQLEPLGVKINAGRLFQVDLARPAAGSTLGTAVLSEIERAVRLLHRLAPRPREDALARFKQQFQTRYEGREVPLVEVLDEEGGIGFDRSNAPQAEASPLLAGVPLGQAVEEGLRFESLHALLLGKLIKAEREHLREVSLTTAELDKVGLKEEGLLPGTFAVMCSLAASSQEALAKGEFRVQLQVASGPSGARLLGRFCHADADLTNRVIEHLKVEESQRPDAIYAEIVHLPEGRVGNIMMRPQLRDHEIAFLGRSGAAEDKQIPLSDLMVSIAGDRVVLRSRRLNREVIPRLSCAHNWSFRSIGAYRFLCILQNQGLAQVSHFDWGPLGVAPYLPRLVSGRTVLARARWQLSEEDVKSLDGGFEAVQKLRARFEMPRFVELSEGDNELPIDLDNPLSVECAIPLMKKGRPTLTEMLPGPDELIAVGPDGRYVQELVIPFVTETKLSAPQIGGEIDRRPAATVVRTLIPGSEWLYARIACGTASGDHILSDVVAPLARELVASGAARKWFFIRYADPDWHLRVRFQGDPERLASEVLPALSAAVRPLLGEGAVSALRLDTYEREVERYGGDEAIGLAEDFFWIDSEAVLDILGSLEGDLGLDARWRFGLVGSDRLLDDLGFDLPKKLALAREMRDGLRKEFKADSATLKAIAEVFRRERDPLLALLRGTAGDFQPGLDALTARSKRLARPFAELRSLQAAGRLTAPMEQIATSYVHMHLNRILRSAHRAQELVIYDLMEKLYLVPAPRPAEPVAAGVDGAVS